MTCRVFGKKEAGVAYHDRAGAYLIDIRRGKVAVVKTAKGCFLPGGGFREGEDAAACIRREVREETGCRAEGLTLCCRAEEYLLHEEIGPFHPMQVYYLGELIESAALPEEPDHTLLWLPIEAAKVKLVSKAQAWAVTTAMENLLQGGFLCL